MNVSLIIGYVARKPKIVKIGKKEICTQFQLVLKSEKPEFTQEERTYINVMAYGELANYVWRNSNRGTLLSVKGFIAGKIDISNNKLSNYVIAESVECLTKRDVILQEFDEFIKKYDEATLKKSLETIRKEYKERVDELHIDNIESSNENIEKESEE